MYQQLWKDLHPGICAINFFNHLGIKQTSMTGFKVHNHIVSEGSICKLSNYHHVIFQFNGCDGITPIKKYLLSFQEFQDRINRIAEYEKEGYALIDVEDWDIAEIPSLDLDLESTVTIGEMIGIVGYNNDQENIGFHKGMVSSFYKPQEGKRYIQFDTALHIGNSGCPLIKLSSGKVIGVVGYRLNTVAKNYESFKSILDENLKMLKTSEGKMTFMDIDPIQVLIANQHQLKQISREFYRTNTLSFGCAHEISSISNYLNLTGRTQMEKSDKNKILVS